MLLNDLHKIKITKLNIDYYKKIYPNIHLRDIIKVSTFELPLGSNRKIHYQCDNCKKIIETDYYSFNRKNTKEDKCYCYNCKNKKTEKTNLQKYGCKNVMQNPIIKEKNKQSVIDKYGVENVFQIDSVKEKSKQTIKEKYGADHVMHVPYIKEKVQEKCIKKMCENGNMTCSSQQKYVCDLYKAKLNYYVDKCCLDMYFDNYIYCEWNGSGHDIDVKYHKITETEFRIKELRRYEFLKSKGFKMFEIVSRKDFIPQDDILLNMKKYAFNKLLNEGYNWVRFDIDNGIVEYKNNKEEYKYK